MAYETSVAWSAHATHPGQRTENQDRVGQIRTMDNTLVCMLSDGMGIYGRSVSAFALQTLASLYASHPYQPPMWLLQQSVEYIHRQVSAWRLSAGIPNVGGCTLDVAAIRPGKLFLAHVGDSRIFLLRGTELYLLTEDHTIPGALLAKGLLSPLQVANHSYRHYPLRYIGSGESPGADYSELVTYPGDRLLLCSDGLWAHLIQADIISHLYQTDPARAVVSLLRRALERGATDNVSLIVIQMRQG